MIFCFTDFIEKMEVIMLETKKKGCTYARTK